MKRGSPSIRRPQKQTARHYYDEADNLPLSDISLNIQNNKYAFLEKEVRADDTLQSLALEFNVTVGELKRVNNIHKENEIYARKIIKVPAKPHSLILETAEYSKPSTSRSGETSKSFKSLTESSALEILSELEDLQYLSTSINNLPSVDVKEETTKVLESQYPVSAQEFESKYFTPIADGVDEKSDDSETERLISTTNIAASEVPVSQQRDTFLSCNGADCDITWPYLIIIIILVVVGIPLIYMWLGYEYEKRHGKPAS